MLRIKPRDAGAERSLRKFVEGSVAFAQRDNLPRGRWRGEKLAETPYAAEVQRCVRGKALTPDRFQSSGIETGLPAGIRDLNQIAALRTTKILGGRMRNRAATDAAETKRDVRQLGSGIPFNSGGRRHGVGDYFGPRKYWSVLLIQSARGGLNTSRSTVSSRASALCSMCAGMHSTSPEW